MNVLCLLYVFSKTILTNCVWRCNCISHRSDVNFTFWTALLHMVLIVGLTVILWWVTIYIYIYIYIYRPIHNSKLPSCCCVAVRQRKVSLMSMQWPYAVITSNWRGASRILDDTYLCPWSWLRGSRALVLALRVQALLGLGLQGYGLGLRILAVTSPTTLHIGL